MGSTPGANKERRRHLMKRYCLCPYCSYHNGDNTFGRRKPKTDKYKSKRKGR